MPDRSLSITTTALLDGLRGEDDEAWGLFDDRYRPVVAGVVRRMGIAAAEAPDLTQDVLVSFLRDYRAGKYERERGRLRSWIAAIARNRVRDFLRRASRGVRKHGESALAEVSAVDEFERVWDEEYLRHKLRVSIDLLRRSADFRAKTFDAFERVELRGESPANVARELGMTLSAVYVATHRCRNRLAEIRTQVDDAFDEGAGVT